MPHRGRAKAIEVMDATGVTLRRWLVAQLIGMVIIGALTTAALLLLDVRAAVALGIIAGILEFVPYFGPILSSVPAIAMGFLDGPEKALWVALAYLAIQQVEGNVVTPLLMKEGLDLPAGAHDYRPGGDGAGVRVRRIGDRDAADRRGDGADQAAVCAGRGGRRGGDAGGAGG